MISNRGGGTRAGLRRGRHPSREHRHDGPARGLQEPRPPPGVGQPLGRPVCLRHGPSERDRIFLGKGERGLQGDIHRMLAMPAQSTIRMPFRADGLEGDA